MSLPGNPLYQETIAPIDRLRARLYLASHQLFLVLHYNHDDRMMQHTASTNAPVKFDPNSHSGLNEMVCAYRFSHQDCLFPYVLYVVQQLEINRNPASCLSALISMFLLMRHILHSRLFSSLAMLLIDLYLLCVEPAVLLGSGLSN